jgi:hypothetical protein
MMNLLIENWGNILTAVVTVVAIYFGLRSRYKGQIAGYILDLVRYVEDEYGGGTGLIKKSRVFGIIYNMLPSLAKLILSKKLIGRLIDSAADEFTKYLEGLKAEQRKRLLSQEVDSNEHNQ